MRFNCESAAMAWQNSELGSFSNVLINRCAVAASPCPKTMPMADTISSIVGILKSWFWSAVRLTYSPLWVNHCWLERAVIRCNCLNSAINTSPTFRASKSVALFSIGLGMRSPKVVTSVAVVVWVLGSSVLVTKSGAHPPPPYSHTQNLTRILKPL